MSTSAPESNWDAGTDHLPRIVIVGGGTAGWMAAAALANAFKGRGGRIALIETLKTSSVDMGEAAIPTIRSFNEKLDIDENTFIRETQATFSLGTEFKGFLRPERSFFHPFGQYGTGIENVGFHHCWFKLRELGDKTDISEYSLATVAAAAGRFRRPVQDSNSILSSFSYGFHFDLDLYTTYLRKYALERGATVEKRYVRDVNLRGDDGFIDALILDDGERLEADLYIDCSGSAGLLIEQALHTGYEDWSRWLPCNRALTFHSANTTNVSPATKISARADGWQWHIPLRDRTGNGYVYSSQFTGDEEAREAVSKCVGASVEPVLLQFTNGRRKAFWNKNCFALGAAAGFLEPLESTGIHLLQSGISRLLQLLPAGHIDLATIEEYNRLIGAEYQHVRDFLILHYCMNEHADLAFWSHCRNAPIPDTLSYKIDTFKSRGRVVSGSGEVFFLPSWLSLFCGLNVVPQRYHPFADSIDVSVLKHRAGFIRMAIRQATEAMPDHRIFLAQTVSERTT